MYSPQLYVCLASLYGFAAFLVCHEESGQVCACHNHEMECLPDSYFRKPAKCERQFLRRYGNASVLETFNRAQDTGKILFKFAIQPRLRAFP